MPAVNRRSRVSPAKQEAVQQCIALLSTGDNKLVKVRSIGSPSPAGDSEVQVAFPSGDSIECNLPQNLQGQLLFRGSGFFIVAPPASSTQGHPALTGSTSEQEQQQQQVTVDSSTHHARPNKASTVAAETTASTEPSWQVVYVLADEDLPELARQGLWPQEFEAEGIDGISSGQKVDLRTVPRVEPPAPAVSANAQKSVVLNRTFYDSEEDEEDEEHELGCACCPGGRNVVFRVY